MRRSSANGAADSSKMTRRVSNSSIRVSPGQSLIAPVIIEGLPAQIHALGQDWQRKREFHLTAASAKALERAGKDRDDLWDVVTEVASGRSMAPIQVGREIRRVSSADTPELRTLIVLADAPRLIELHRALSAALGTELHPPPAHITLYSTDPDQGIGLDDERELEERAPALTEDEQYEARQAMDFDRALPDDPDRGS